MTRRFDKYANVWYGCSGGAKEHRENLKSSKAWLAKQLLAEKYNVASSSICWMGGCDFDICNEDGTIKSVGFIVTDNDIKNYWATH